MKPKGVEAYPLHWPGHWPRADQPRASRFNTTLAKARDGLFAEIKRLGGVYVVLSTNIPLRRDGLPYANHSQPADRGVAVYFLRRGKGMVFACDRWNKVEDNIRAIEKTIQAIRGIESWGASEMMERAFSAFEALSPPKTCWQVLGVPPGADVSTIQTAYRNKARAAHPDVGGAGTDMVELNRARDEAVHTRVRCFGMPPAEG